MPVTRPKIVKAGDPSPLAEFFARVEESATASSTATAEEVADIIRRDRDAGNP